MADGNFDMSKMPNISLGTDAFGVGGIFSGLGGMTRGAQGTVDCGSRPNCIGWSDGCKEKQAGYYACVQAASGNNAAAKIATSRIVVVSVVAVVIVALILVLVLRKTK